ncbi:thiamine diphosphokinase [Terrisporobacter sp.]|uniref:thiamine diphosphokinase n=1 Tax=Terrisporobacter sp. TaxID=1965305 RepID=UPI0026356BFE|nr:thiamine diphosphokinase [Terrisporobacter sp.]
MKVCIILNGEVKDYIKTKEIILEENYDYIIGADGGCNHLFKMNIIPNYIVGDLDSIEREVIEYYENKNVIFKRYPSHKDETDSEICIYLAKSLGADEIDLFATLGGRIDHTLANIGLMNYIKENSIRPRILTSEEEIFMVKNETINLKGKKGDTISVISINGESKGVTLEKLEYPLDNAIVNHLSPLGISNVMLEDECIISIDDGCALIIRNFNI